MLLFLVALALLVVLLAANMENRASFSFVFTRMEEVPVFLALLVAFIAGALTMLPFTIGRRHPRASKHRKPSGDHELQERPREQESAAPIAPPPDAPLDTGGRGRKRRPRRRRVRQE